MVYIQQLLTTVEFLVTRLIQETELEGNWN